MSGANALEGLVHPEFFETIDRYQPLERDLRAVVEELVPANWIFERNTVWFGCHPPPAQAPPLPTQGWKIHVSAVNGEGERVLRAVVPILAARLVAFKFALDSQMLAFMNSKQWVRQGSGKFITIYPRDDREFIDLIEALYLATAGLAGPYILSDRRYKDSRVIFYRYGGIRPLPVLTAHGDTQYMLVSPSGELTPDLRVPYFVMPPWVQDPFGTPPPETPSEITLKDGRYVVKSVLRYSNSGGIYTATDTSNGQEVVIKEGRPMVTSTEDATTLLRKEHRLLTRIAHLRVAPQPIDMFQDWEHVFLVQELITGENLTAFCARKNVTLLPQATREDTERYYKQFKQIFLQLAATLDGLHACGIVFADLSPSNLIIDPETMKLTILDFEAAVEAGVDKPVQLFTEGFTFIDQAQGKPSTMQSDYFAMGAIMHHALWPINQMFMISPRSRYTFIASVVKDIGFPASIRDLVAGLLDRDADKRPTPAAVIATLERDDDVSEPWTMLDTWSPEDPDLTASLRDTVRDIVRYISASADYSRRDRLVPADGSVFRTNPLSVAYGACGVAYVLHRVGADTAPIVDWIRGARVNADLYPPGLYVGLSGVAWTLLELGAVEQAERAMNMVYAHPLRTSEIDLFEGVAGIGLTSLRFFAATQDERHLTEAIAAGRYLLQARTEDGTGSYWLREGERPLGLAHGGSGIALFLLYLTLASGDEEFLEVGRRAVDSELSEGVVNGSVISWPRLAERRHILYPYWRFGSAGVGTAWLRYHRVLGTPLDPMMIDRILGDTNRKYAIFPGYFAGLSGLGEFLLDAHAHLGERRFLQGAYRVASGLSLFRIEKPDGLAFPGETLRRISCDYGTGSAGVAHFLHRLTHRDTASAFLLDDVFDATRTSDRTLATPVEA